MFEEVRKFEAVEQQLGSDAGLARHPGPLVDISELAGSVGIGVEREPAAALGSQPRQLRGEVHPGRVAVDLQRCAVSRGMAEDGFEVVAGSLPGAKAAARR